MIRFPSIEQFRNVIKNVTHRAQWAGRDEAGEPVFNRDAALPKLKFRGTVKLHGTNSGIVIDRTNGDITFQSRERELTITSDNAGFALYMESKKDLLRQMSDGIINYVNPTWDNAPDKVVIFGEWCGSNIQKGIAISGLPKMFVIFGVKFIWGSEDEHGNGAAWIDIANIKHIVSHEDHIYNVLEFGSYEVEIDFAKPHEIQNKLIELTIAVEEKCPAGVFFGKEGVGEGIVWSCQEEGWRKSNYWFKVKGEKHSASKVKVLAAVDVEAIKQMEDFVDMAVTEARLEQGLQNLVNEQQKPFEMTSMGDFIRWVFNDVVKEEMDTIVANQLDPKKLGGPIATKARKWFIAKLNEEG
jgi:hypothetical protein